MKLAIVLLQQYDGGEDDDNLLQKRRDAATKLLIAEGVTTADIQPSTSSSTDTRIIFQSNPALYRKIDGIARNETVQGRLEIIQQCVTEEGDVALGCELERRAQQQLQRDEHTNVGSGVKQQQQLDGNVQSSNDDIATLSDKLQSGIRLNNDEEDDDYRPHPTTKQSANSRKAQKAAQKKSKKAKRREKEDAVEREEKIAAERARQKEREERLGLQQQEKGGASAVNETASTSTNNTTSQASSSNNGENKACNTCGGSFAPHEYRSHFRSDWHRYNVKLKLKGCATVSEKEFLLCDSDAFF